MKKFVLLIGVVAALSACSSPQQSSESTSDALISEMDTSGMEIDSMAMEVDNMVMEGDTAVSDSL